MAMYGSTWRKHPLVVGDVYIANKNFPEFTDGTINIGNSYKLEDIFYSHYDGASIFVFTCLKTKEIVSWWWYDDNPDELCDKKFTKVT